LLATYHARQICSDAAAQVKDPRQIESSNTIGGVERLARSDRRLAATVDQWDADPWLLNTPAGTVDLRSGGECRPHQQSDYLTKITGTTPDSSCPIPLWLEFLARVTDNKADFISYLQRVVGYALTGSTEEQALFFLYGTGANGKSTFLSTITAAIGDYHRTASIETSLPRSRIIIRPTLPACVTLASLLPSKSRKDAVGPKAASRA
jgi:putative DNA primase/helicase